MKRNVHAYIGHSVSIITILRGMVKERSLITIMFCVLIAKPNKSQYTCVVRREIWAAKSERL